MLRRAPQWYTNGTVRAKVQKWWPWALGAGLAALYAYNPEPMEELRVATLATMRRPLLRGTEWLEVHDVDPETLALELPPDQIFGPLRLEQQMKFVLNALRQDNELADGYVARLIIDMMDLSIDPPPNNDFVKYGGKELLEFAIDDFSGKRENRKNKFFTGDQFLRLLTICAPYYELSDYFVRERDGVALVFRALESASNEYARVLATRSLTLFAFLQQQDGDVERRIIEGGFVPRLLESYHQSTGDPTDTRFTTLLLSSMLRLYPQQAYEELTANNVFNAVTANMNISRYKGIPQHLRLIQDLEKAQLAVAEGKRHHTPPAWMRTVSRPVVANAAPEMAKPSRLAAMAERSRKSAELASKGITDAADEKRVQESMRRANGTTEVAAAVEEPVEDTLALPPPADLYAPVDRLLYEADFLPVALGVMDVFPEYFETSVAITRMVERMRTSGVTSNFELLEYRVLPIMAKVIARLERDPNFEAQGGAAAIERVVAPIFRDPACVPFTRRDRPQGSTEMQTAAANVRTFLEQRENLRRQAELSAPMDGVRGAAAPAL